MRKPNVSRTGKRLSRLAYELETIANRLKEAGLDRHANGVRDLAHHSGNIGRALDRITHGGEE